MTILTSLETKALGVRRRMPFVSRTFKIFGYVRRYRFSSKSFISQPLVYSCVALLMGALFYSSLCQAPFVASIETFLLDVSAPVIQKMREGTSSISAFFQKVQFFRDACQKVCILEEQNKNLFLQNIQLQQDIFLHKNALEASRIIPTLQDNLTAQRYIQLPVIGAFSYHHPLILDSSHVSMKISKNDCVLGKKGLLGRVMNAGSRTAKIMTIFDPMSRVPVDLQGIQAIAVGDGTCTLHLLHMQDAQQEITVGSVAVTSGFGGVFPKGIPVGVVTKIENGHIDLTPFDTELKQHTVTMMISPSYVDEDDGRA